MTTPTTSLPPGFEPVRPSTPTPALPPGFEPVRAPGASPEGVVVPPGFDAPPAAAGQERPLPQPGPEPAGAAAAPPDVDTRIRTLFQLGLQIPPSEAAGVNYLARELDLPPRLVAQQYPLFKQAAEAAAFDPARFRRENPGLVELLLENPQSGIHPKQAEQISPVTKALRATFSVLGDVGSWIAATGADRSHMARAFAGSGALGPDAAKELRPDPKSLTPPGQIWPEPKEVPTRQSEWKGRHGPESTAAILAAEGRRGLLAVELGDVGFSLLVAYQVGENPELLRRRQLEIEQELGVQVDYGQNALEQLGMDAEKAVTSQWAPLREGGKAYAAGAAIVGLATLAATRSPREAARSAHLGGLMFGKVGFSYGSFKQEAGTTFAKLLDEKLDDGTPLDRDVAAGAAFLYGVAAAAVETAAFGQLAGSLGGLKEAIARGEGRAALRAWMADRSKRQILKDIGRAWAKAAASEPLEEGTQTTLQYAITWAGKSLDAGQVQKFDREAFVREAAESFYLGAVGGATMAAPGAATDATLRFQNLEASRRRGFVVAELAKLAGTEAALGAPRAVAELVGREARRAGAGDLTHVYLDAEAAETLFQSRGTDAATALSELLGEDMRGKVAAAKAGENLGRIEIPLATYLEKLGPTGAAEALAGDTAVRPFDATLNEQARLQQDLMAEAQDAVQLWQKTGKEPEAEPGEVEWAQDLAAKAFESGAAKKADAQRFQQVARAFVRTMVKRYGEPARALMKRYAVDVQPAEKMPPLAEGQAAVPQAAAAGGRAALEQELQAAEAELAAARAAPDAAGEVGGVRVGDAAVRVEKARQAVAAARAAAPAAAAPGEAETLQATQAGADQGWTRFYRVARKGLNQLFQVATTKDADASTLLHESAHVFLEILGDLSEEAGAPAALQAEYSRVLEWLGATKREELTRDHHEKFAGAFETYLYEGKTPSIRLASVFARMRAWFLRVGRALRGAGVPLNDEIRGLFDRMLATDAEIAAVREQMAAGEAADVFPSAEAAGLTPEQYDEYLAAKERAFDDARVRVQQRLLAEQRAANERAVREARKDARARAAAEFEDLRESRVLRFLRRGDTQGNPALRALQEAAREREAAAGGEVEVPPELAARLAELEREEADLRASGGTRRVLLVVGGEFQTPGTADGRGAPTNQPPLFRVRVRMPSGRLERDEQLRVVTLPAWLPTDEYLAARDAWEWVWEASSRARPQAEQRWLFDMVVDGDLQRAHAAGRILAAPRTEYQEKLAAQIREWLAQAPAARRHDSPLAPKQWESLARNPSAFRRWEIATRRTVKHTLSGMGEAVEPEEADVVSQALGEETDPRLARYEAIEAERAELDRQVAEARVAQQRGRVKLDLEAVVDVVGVKEAERAFRGVARPDGGLHPDVLADVFSFRTGEELVRAVAGLGERDAWIASRTEVLLANEQPALLLEGERLREAVTEAEHAKGDLEYYLKQWAIFRSKAGDRGMPPLEAVKRAADGIVRGKQAGKLNLKLALDAEMGAARRAAEAAGKGNWKQASVLMQQAVLNREIYRALLEARQDRDELERMAKTMTPEKYRGQIGRVSIAIRDAIDQVLEAVGLRDRIPRDVAPLPLSEAIRAMESFGTSVLLDVELLERLFRQPVRHTELLVSDMRKVRDALKNLRAAALSQEEVLDGDRRIQRDQAVEQLQAEAMNNTPALPPAKEDVQKNVAEKISGFGATAHGEVLRISTMIRWLGGGDVTSAWHRLVLAPLQAAKHREVQLLEGPFKAVLEAFDKMPADVRRRLNAKVDGRALFPTHRTDLVPPGRRFQLLMLALNAGNESNLDRLLQGRGITMGQLEAALATLTRAELEWVQQVWDACESLWPLSRELEERDAGVAPPKIPARPLTVRSRDGHEVNLRGGYFPAAYVRAVSTAGEKQALQAVQDVLSPGFIRPGTPHSHLKGRVDGFTDALATDPAIIMRHLTQVAHDLAFREPLKSVASLLMDPRVQDTLKRRLGPERSPQFLQWLKDIGGMRAAENAAAANGFLKLGRALRSNLAIGVLGYAADVALGDVTNLGVAVLASPLKARWWATGLGEFARHPLRAVKWTGEKSGELAYRRQKLGEDFRRHIDGMTSRSPLKRGPLERFKRYAFVFMEASDLVTSTPIWMGAYHQAAAQGRPEAEAIAFADDLVRRLFPSHSAVDTSFMVRRKDGYELLMLFQGYASVLANLYLDKAHQIHAGRDVSTKARKTVEFALFSLALGTVASVAADVVMGHGPTDEDDDDEVSGEELGAWYGRRLLAGWAYVVPIFGWTVEAVLSAVRGERPSARIAPFYSGLEGTARAAQRALAAAEDEEFTEAEAIEVLKSLGILAGVPAVRPARALQFGIDLWQGEVEETAPVDVVEGFLYGPPRE